MQKAPDMIQIHQYAHDPVSCAGHGKESVRHLIFLAAAIVCPQVRNLMIGKRLNVIVGGNRSLHQSFFIKIKVA